MKTHASLCTLLKSQYINIALLLGFMAATNLPTGIRDAFGYFNIVLICFAILFICLEIHVITIH